MYLNKGIFVAKKKCIVKPENKGKKEARLDICIHIVSTAFLLFLTVFFLVFYLVAGKKLAFWKLLCFDDGEREQTYFLFVLNFYLGSRTFFTCTCTCYNQPHRNFEKSLSVGLVRFLDSVTVKRTRYHSLPTTIPPPATIALPSLYQSLKAFLNKIYCKTLKLLFSAPKKSSLEKSL